MKNIKEPIEYKRGYAMFLGCKIDLSKKPLIPRKETEYWVKKAIKDIKNKINKKLFILDIFTGSGCIGLAILKYVKNVKVDFADIENRAVGIKIIKTNIFGNIKGRYNYIFANPPYIPIKNKSMVQKSVLDFEPSNALFAGEDGLFYIRKFLKQAKKHLTKRGSIYLEFDSPQKEEIEKLLKKYKYKTWQFNKDQYGKYRWLVIS